MHQGGNVDQGAIVAMCIKAELRLVLLETRSPSCEGEVSNVISDCFLEVARETLSSDMSAFFFFFCITSRITSLPCCESYVR